MSTKPWRNKRLRTPSILQMEATECGAASLAMIMAYHKFYVPLEKLRADCGVSRDGSNAANVLRAARKYGFEAKGYKTGISGLYSFHLPLIIFWKFNHFVVLEGRKGKYFFINDPASGPRRVHQEEFNSSFTGIALQLIPNSEFKTGGSPPPLFRALLKRLSNMKQTIAFITISSILLAIPGLVLPSLSRIFVDDVLGPNNNWLAPLLMALAGTVLVQFILTWMQRIAIRKLTIAFLTSNSSFMLYHLLRLPINFYMQRSSGEIQYRTTLSSQISEMIGGQAGQAFTSLFMIIFYGALLLFYNIPLALVGISFAVLNVWALRFVSARRKVLNQALIQESGKLMSTTMSGIQLIESIKAHALENDFFANWSGQQAKSLKAQQCMAASSIMLSALPTTLSSINNAVILLFGSWRVINGDMSIGMLVAFQALMGAFLSPIAQLTQLGSQIQETKGALDKIEDIFNYKRDIVYQQDKQKLPRHNIRGELHLQNITYGYSPVGPPLLQNFSLHIKPGKRVAVVGRSGSGKSTVAKIAAGLYQPWEGQVLYDGLHLSDWPRKYLENMLAVVDQDIILFGDSILNNISLWNPVKTEQEIICGCKDACIHADILKRNQGYNTLLNEGGGNFSGGQRQRLEIARALASDPVLLILDEATSALDPETESQIDNHIRRRGCSCLIIAHRLSTIRDCDQIIVLDKGQIVQQGTHSELVLDKSGAYIRMIGE